MMVEGLLRHSGERVGGVPGVPHWSGDEPQRVRALQGQIHAGVGKVQVPWCAKRVVAARRLHGGEEIVTRTSKCAMNGRLWGENTRVQGELVSCAQMGIQRVGSGILESELVASHHRHGAAGVWWAMSQVPWMWENSPVWGSTAVQTAAAQSHSHAGGSTVSGTVSVR